MKKVRSIFKRSIVMIIMMCMFVGVLTPMEDAFAADNVEVYVGNLKHPEMSNVTGLVFSTHLVAVYDHKTNQATFYLKREVTDESEWGSRAKWLGDDVYDEAKRRVSQYGHDSATFTGTFTLSKKDAIDNYDYHATMLTVKKSSGGKYVLGAEMMLQGADDLLTYTGGAIQLQPLFLRFAVKRKDGKKTAINFTVSRGSKSDIPKERRFTIKRDNFSFVNSGSSFVSNPEQGADAWYIFRQENYSNSQIGYYIDDEAYSELTKDMNFIQKANINKRLGWSVSGGLCSGMSTLSGLIFQGSENLKDYTGKETTFKAEAPKSNRKLLSKICWYQLFVNMKNRGGIIKNIKKFLDMDCTYDIKEVVSKLQKELPNPLYIGFSFKRANGGTGGHAVLAIDIKETTGKYNKRIVICDPNRPNKSINLYVNTKTGKYELEGYEKATINNVYSMSEISGKAATDAKLGNKQLLIEAEGNLTITNGTNKLVVKNGKITTKKGFKAASIGGTDSLDKTAQVLIGNYNSNKPLNVTSKSADAAASILKSNELITATGKKSVKITVAKDGTVTAKTGNKNVDGTLDVISEKTATAKPGISVKADGGTISIKPTKDGGDVKTPGCDDADITVSGGADSKKKNDVDAREGVHVNTENGDIKIEGKGGSLTPTVTPTVTPTPTPSTDGGTGSDKKVNYQGIELPGNTDKRVVDFVPSEWSADKGGSNAFDTDGFVPGIYVREDGKSIMYIWPAYEDYVLPFEVFTVGENGKKDLVIPSSDKDLYQAQGRTEPETDPFFYSLGETAYYFTCNILLKSNGTGKLTLQFDGVTEDLFTEGMKDYASPYGNYTLVYSYSG